MTGILDRSSSTTLGELTAPAPAPESIASENVGPTVLVEWRRAGSDVWHTVRGAPGETFDELERFLRTRWPDCAQVRPR